MGSLSTCFETRLTRDKRENNRSTKDNSRHHHQQQLVEGAIDLECAKFSQDFEQNVERTTLLNRPTKNDWVCLAQNNTNTNKNKNNAEKQNETTQAQRQSRPQVPAQTETPSDVFSHARGRFIRRVSRTGETWDGEPNRVKRGRAGDGEVLLQSDREALRKRVGVEESHQDEKV